MALIISCDSGSTDSSQTINTKTNEDKTTMDDNKLEGEAFLAENAKKEGVTVTASGLQYEVIASGSGATPTLSDTVETHYTGRFMDGTEFDSSVTRGQPLTFPVTGVIAGWTEALQLMQEGDKWKLYIPSELAYGERGVGPIPPNATLIFDIELLAVK
ncbi:MAG: FKBP-type peptidyl-prolyl cis-trans isomerase [Pseudomonadales bacterium]|nr:FKBP-type peptidyl-prolyl cis-trans isomerase [Pseudomonadales bacterium]MDG1000997.1 FKBP-type peptidyl-prolyl cis-trans isomerase [Pseudomonadales bacterium]MDG1305140.1 FKBP-type peptidyl-prolyl cis-trans isomerase [Pseudomonadales bacterium]MDG1909258.1 FKBP-type peptidyl-prolyl cis-trans isomerase [Pseudomonadales bacterium]